MTSTMIRKVGKFSVSQYHDLFGNLWFTFKTSDINREQQLRAEIVRVWELLGHQPSRAEMAEYGTVTRNTIEHHLGQWDDICTEPAQSSELPTDNKPAATQPDKPSSDGDDTVEIPDAIKTNIEQDDRWTVCSESLGTAISIRCPAHCEEDVGRNDWTSL